MIKVKIVNVDTSTDSHNSGNVKKKLEEAMDEMKPGSTIIEITQNKLVGYTIFYEEPNG